LAGYANTLTREFLKAKEVNFFLDFDIEGMNIYESFECKSKNFHMPKDIERFFLDKRFHNVVLYKKQRAKLKNEYSKELLTLKELIAKHNTVVEQEIVYENK
jgi:hypothetical protein